MTTTKPLPTWQVKGISEEARRKIKAAAAIRGITIGQAVEEALNEWCSKVLQQQPE